MYGYIKPGYDVAQLFEEHLNAIQVAARQICDIPLHTRESQQTAQMWTHLKWQSRRKTHEIRGDVCKRHNVKKKRFKRENE